MLMSKSRLEKFLYALYSLDSSDLPTPLSRIEELYKCWVTGEEAPTFEPLSRVEKYLMAILGVYDVDSIPNPISRVEVLLYKLATGDDNLDDVEIFLSEHEELLAEIIRNGGVGGNIDIEYVLYTLSTEHNTLYNTAEKPVKSAILKGQTLVNLVKTSSYGGVQSGTCVDGDTGYKVIDSIVKTGAIILTRVKTIYPLSPSTVYYLKLTDVAHTNSFLVREQDNGVNLTTENHDLENKIIKFTTSELGTSDLLFYQRELQVGAKVKYSDNFIISDNVDSLYNADDYFTGMQSVKMPVLTTTGKNLLPCKTIYNNSSFKGLTVNTENNRVRISGTATGICDIEFFNINTISDDEYIKVKPNTKYILSATLHSGSISGKLNLACKSITDDGTIRWLGSTFTTNSNESKVNRIRIAVPLGFVFNDAVISLQLEESTVATSYEPYKSNILTVNEEVELRGIGDIRDELDCLTGKVTKRIGEVVLDGSEGWDKGMNNTKLPYRFICANLLNHSNYKEICDSFKTGQSYWGVDTTGLYIGGNHKLVITFESGDDRNNYTVAEFKQYLSENPITVQYYLTTESIKTVDLSVVDQDGNSTKLSTFNDITHVTLSSEALIPEAELEVATKNKEVLSTLSLEMDDISTTQNDLQETSDAQSENVDATMIATTEIYEELL